jgi:hypothetical protein
MNLRNAYIVEWREYFSLKSLCWRRMRLTSVLKGAKDQSDFSFLAEVLVAYRLGSCPPYPYTMYLYLYFCASHI